jgi:hypothetical protein
MSCPKCDNEMMQGYLHSGREIIWSPQKRIRFDPPPGEVRFKRQAPFKGNGFLTTTMIAQHCPTCKVVLTQYTENNAKLY